MESTYLKVIWRVNTSCIPFTFTLTMKQLGLEIIRILRWRYMVLILYSKSLVDFVGLLTVQMLGYNLEIGYDTHFQVYGHSLHIQLQSLCESVNYGLYCLDNVEVFHMSSPTCFCHAALILKHLIFWDISVKKVTYVNFYLIIVWTIKNEAFVSKSARLIFHTVVLIYWKLKNVSSYVFLDMVILCTFAVLLREEIHLTSLNA
jgi:hypothetical protein